MNEGDQDSGSAASQGMPNRHSPSPDIDFGIVQSQNLLIRQGDHRKRLVDFEQIDRPDIQFTLV